MIEYIGAIALGGFIGLITSKGLTYILGMD